MREIKAGQVYRRRGVTMRILEIEEKTELRPWTMVKVVWRSPDRAPMTMSILRLQAQRWAHGAKLEIGAR